MSISQDYFFTVVMPTHNRAGLLKRAVASVLTQTYKDFELIIVNDASSDNTREVVDGFSDERIHYLYREECGSASAARNTGICAASGNYVAFLDDDDEFLPTFLEEMKNLIDANLKVNPGFLWCNVVREYEEKDGVRIVEDLPWKPHFASLDKAYEGFLRHRRTGTNYGLVVRRDCFDRVGLFDESMPAAEDTDFLIRMAREYPFAVIPKTLVKVHIHSGPRLTAEKIKNAIAYEKIIEKHNEFIESKPSLAADLYYKTGWLFYASQKKRIARSYIGKCLKAKPFYLKAYTALFIYEILGKYSRNAHIWISGFAKKIIKPKD